MAWSDVEITNDTELQKIESEILDLSPTGSWGDKNTGKISLAIEILGDMLEIELTNRGLTVDESSDEVLLDIIHNPEVFNLSCAYLTLYLIYDDLSNGGQDEGYAIKAKKYKQKFEQQFKKDYKRINLDIDLDNKTDIYRTDWKRYIIR